MSEWAQVIVAILVLGVYAWWYGNGPWNGGRPA